jgi:hypothetical protein
MQHEIVGRTDNWNDFRRYADSPGSLRRSIYVLCRHIQHCYGRHDVSGAFFAVLGSYTFHSWAAGILCAILGSLLMAAIFILFAVYLHTDEFVTGIALNLFSVGATTYLLRQIFNVKGAFAHRISLPSPALTCR